VSAQSHNYTLLDAAYAFAIGVGLGVLLGLVATGAMGCGPHDKHYRTRGQAQHFSDCRSKCTATTAQEWHERRR
jgi:hypothetical protein